MTFSKLFNYISSVPSGGDLVLPSKWFTSPSEREDYIGTLLDSGYAQLVTVPDGSRTRVLTKL